MPFADGKHLIDLAEIIFGYREFGYDLWSEIREPRDACEPCSAYVAVGEAPFRGEPGGALRSIERGSMPTAWEALEDLLTDEAILTMRMKYGFYMREINMAFNGPRGGLALRFRQILAWVNQGVRYPDYG